MFSRREAKIFWATLPVPRSSMRAMTYLTLLEKNIKTTDQDQNDSAWELGTIVRARFPKRERLPLGSRSESYKIDLCRHHEAAPSGLIIVMIIVALSAIPEQ